MASVVPFIISITSLLNFLPWRKSERLFHITTEPIFAESSQEGASWLNVVETFTGVVKFHDFFFNVQQTNHLVSDIRYTLTVSKLFVLKTHVGLI